MNFFMNLFRSSSPAWKQINAKPLTTKKVKKNIKPAKHSTDAPKYELSKLLTSLLRNNNYQFTTIANVLNILGLHPKTSKLHTKNTIANLFNRHNAKFNGNNKTSIN
jgi:hypothetical protein